MFRTFLSLVVLCWAAVGLAEDHFSTRHPSPGGRFAMRITEPAESENAEVKIELAEKTSGKRSVRGQVNCWPSCDVFVRSLRGAYLTRLQMRMFTSSIKTANPIAK
jgi:hypothetical protein